jgi:hypothetical protein
MLTTTAISPYLGYHHYLMIFAALAIILLCTSPDPSKSRRSQRIALLLAGCSSSSPLIPGIFLLSLYYQPWTPTFDSSQNDPAVFEKIQTIVGHAQLEVRVGYFGICVNDGGAWLCSNNATALAASYSPDTDPLNLIWVAKSFKDDIVFPYLV